jgi:hypothetical protein
MIGAPAVRVLTPCLVAVTACSFSPGLTGTEPPRDASVEDGLAIDVAAEDATVVIDAAIDGPVIPDLCYGVAPFSLCLSAAPTAPLSLSGTYDTDACTGGEVLGQGGGGRPDLCVRAGTMVTVSGTYTVRGTLPHVVIATQSLTVGAGTRIDVSSSSATDIGAGANFGCGSMPPTSDSGGAGGGAGGSFGSAGGTGGRGSAGSIAGGTAGLTANPGFLRGGCRGQAGGNASGSGGRGGNSGGAIYLVSDGTLTISGEIDASGEGGRGGTGKAGGGGGGSGGMIVLHGQTSTMISGSIWANGGGGGGGADANDNGLAGAKSNGPTTRGAGGNGGDEGGPGGGGAIEGTPAAPGVQGGKGGGGGGGGTGRVKVLSPFTSSGTISPAPS